MPGRIWPEVEAKSLPLQDGVRSADSLTTKVTKSMAIRPAFPLIPGSSQCANRPLLHTAAVLMPICEQSGPLCSRRPSFTAFGVPISRLCTRRPSFTAFGVPISRLCTRRPSFIAFGERSDRLSTRRSSFTALGERFAFSSSRRPSFIVNGEQTGLFSTR